MLRPRPQACSAGDGGNTQTGSLASQDDWVSGLEGPRRPPCRKGDRARAPGLDLAQGQTGGEYQGHDRNSGPRCSEFQPTPPCTALQACPSMVSRGWNQLIRPPGSPGGNWVRCWPGARETKAVDGAAAWAAA